jgi:hypothetical protein
MSRSQEVTFHISGEVGEILPDSPLWNLSLSDKAFKKGARRESTPKITIGDYFLAARKFLLKDDCGILKTAFREQAGKPFGSSTHPVFISLSLEKHGAFYHPLRVVVRTHAHSPCSMVMNGAVGGPGLALIEKEFDLLSRMNLVNVRSVVPRVYGIGVDDLPTGPVGFFLGEWFEDYHEFHVVKRDGEYCICVWADESRYLSLEAAAPIYENISFILTSAYDVDTGEQISPWHHAAGDFIVNPEENGFPVKLITVRGIEKLVDMDELDPGVSRLVGLLFFFLNMTLRMQLDKISGVGETVFLGQQVLKATLTGFLKGLDAKSEKLSCDLKKDFMEFMAGFSREQIFAILANVVDEQRIDPDETAIIRDGMEYHCQLVHALLKTGGEFDFY